VAGYVVFVRNAGFAIGTPIIARCLNVIQLALVAR